MYGHTETIISVLKIPDLLYSSIFKYFTDLLITLDLTKKSEDNLTD